MRPFTFNKTNTTITKIEHSENRIISYAENKVGFRMIQSRFDTQAPCKNSRKKRTESRKSQGPRHCACDIFAACMFVASWTGALQIGSRFGTAQTL